MSNTLISIIIANLIVSSGSLVGVLAILIKPALLNRFLLPLVSLSAGTMLGAAFLHQLPESIQSLTPHFALQLTLVSFISFFILERLLHWRHCHDEQHLAKHTIGIMNLVGDGIHNFIDGLLIAASFVADPSLGLVAVFAIALHEIPQEIGDFGVLLHSGFSRTHALLANIAVSLTAILGGIVGYFVSSMSGFFASYLISIAAGGFIYIAAADLIPELKLGRTSQKTLTNIITFILGIVLMLLVKE